MTVTSLALDNRRLAMLREMGVRLWQPPPAPPVAPVAPPAQYQNATDLIAAYAHSTGAVGINDTNVGIQTPPLPTPATAPRTLPATPRQAAPDASAASAGSAAAAGWQLGDARQLYTDTAAPDGAGAGPRWLVLGETPAASLRKPVFDPFDGDAGRLLSNMLRAAGLHKSGQPGEAGPVLFAPLARLAAGGVSPAASPAELADRLAALVAQTRPDVLVVMGRLAAQAVLQSSEPLGKLRGQLHLLQGVKTVVTYDAAVLLRSPQDKAKAWEDLCLAMELAEPAPPGGPGLAS